MVSQIYYRGFFPLLFLSLTFFILSSSNAQTCDSTGGIAVYWGQNTGEGTLHDACATGNYKYVVIQYLHIYDDGSYPELKLAGGDTEDLGSDIVYCQSQDIKVLLSHRTRRALRNTYTSTWVMILSWNEWTSKIALPNNTVFLGIPADSYATGGSGYIEPKVLKSQVLPELKKASNYGGVMIYNRYFDSLNGYSDQIKDSVPKSVCDNDSAYNADKKFYGLLRQS
ncbi:Acidic endochitinase [Senna tora]|uniref:Acidic endochitinase n=1 Tax=Senna tora TaxID=362788 RepID=A0A834W8H6_9FABA|nr:Acidic endochitinase [Senna tora]